MTPVFVVRLDPDERRVFYQAALPDNQGVLDADQVASLRKLMKRFRAEIQDNPKPKEVLWFDAADAILLRAEELLADPMTALKEHK